VKLHELSPAPGSRTKAYRKGRGPGSGNGKTAGKGHKGQNARSDGGVRPGFEGGQMPLQRRIPKRGFNNIFAKEFAVINVSALNAFEDGATVDTNAIVEMGLVKQALSGVKILGDGELTKKLNVSLPLLGTRTIKNAEGEKSEVKTMPYSKSAKEKIEAAGGKAEVI
jgi:large subunit ribosomal protein L15